MSVGKLSSYFTKRRDAASFKDPEEGSDKRPTSSVRARLEKKLHVKQKTGFAFNFDLVEDEGLEKGDARGSSTERESCRFEFDPTETPGDVGTSVGGKQHRCGGDADPREDDDFVVHVVSGMSTAPRSAKKKGKRKAGGKKKKSGKGKGKGAGNPDRHPAENELNRERDESTGSPTKDAAIVVPSPALATNEGCQSDDPDAGRMEPSPVPVVARPPPGLTLESWKDPALTLEERRRRRFGRGVRNMAAIQRSRDARRGAGVGAADLAAEEVVPDSNTGSNQGGLAKPDPDRARGESSRASGSSVFAFGFDIGISFNEGR
ncbi:unnamed protein product [Laminaria digitata]